VLLGSLEPCRRRDFSPLGRTAEGCVLAGRRLRHRCLHAVWYSICVRLHQSSPSVPQRHRSTTPASKRWRDGQELLLLVGRLVQAEGYDGELSPAQWMALRYFARANPFSQIPRRQQARPAGEMAKRPRNIHHYAALRRAADYIGGALFELGYRPAQQTYEARGKTFANIIAELSGEALVNELVVIGAHYDSHKDSPGPDDNASAIAALLELARAAMAWQPRHTLRFVAFTNEESPFTCTEHMGSQVYARACRENGDHIVAMLCLEMLGCYSERSARSGFSFGGLFLPRRGDFLALVGNRNHGHF